MPENFPDKELEEEVPDTAKIRSGEPSDAGEAFGGEAASFDLAGLLQAASYPATKEDLIDYATDQGVEDYVIQMIDQLPDTTYNSPADVSQALGENANEVT